jgi:hypothetical protein
MKNKIKYFLAVGLLALVTQACKDDLAGVKNRNAPTFDALKGEIGIKQLAKGGVYINGFGGYYSTIDDGLGTGFLLLVYGQHESMGDVIYVPWGNNNFKFLDNPTDIKLDNGTVVPCPIGVSNPIETRLRNDRAYGASNPMLIEWTYMYNLNNVCNSILANVDATAFSGNADTKKNTLKAWAYWWKGYAYSRIGSAYVGGLIIDEPYATNGNYVSNTALIDEANANFDKAASALGAGITSVDDYTSTLNDIMPDYVRPTGAPTPAEWIRSINTMKARNLIANKRVADMVAGDWTQLKTLADQGVQAGDNIFVIKTTSNPSQSIIDPFFGAVGPYTATNDPTYFVSERLIQDFRTGDDRFENNFDLLPSPQVNRRGRGLGFGTRYFLVDGGQGVGTALSYVHTEEAGVDNHYLASSYEENELMKAEAEIHLGNIAAGVGMIDAVRNFQGANLAAINPASTSAQALEELRSERRIALLFRSLSFYDARRWGVIDDKSKGGGRANAVVLSGDAASLVVNTAAFINYNYLPYYDVPKNELEYNQPLSGSAPVIGPE